MARIIDEKKEPSFKDSSKAQTGFEPVHTGVADQLVQAPERLKIKDF